MTHTVGATEHAYVLMHGDHCYEAELTIVQRTVAASTRSSLV
jgi:hypothetical protein